MGVSQSLISPSEIALVSHQTSREKIGMGVEMGLIGMQKNVGKVIGPILVGVMVHQMGFTKTFYLASIALLLIASGIAYRIIKYRKNKEENYLNGLVKVGK